jgi:gag-polypeptide of LTR copia-type
MNHVGAKTSAEAMYSALLVTHENKAHQTVNHTQCQLYETKARDGDNLLKHLDILKSYWDHINKFSNPEFHVSDIRFKSIISASFPSTWQTFVEPYNENTNDPNDPDSKHQMSSDAFIGLLHEEFKIWVTRANNRNNNGVNGSVNLVKFQTAPCTSKSLEAQITDRKSNLCSYCEHCKHAGHWTSKCHKLEVNKC